MGTDYVKNLVKLGIEPSQLVVLDIKTERLNAASEQYPDIIAVPSLEEALTRKPKAAFVLTNTPFHYPIIKNLLSGGVANLFVEKPLVWNLAELSQLETHLTPETNIFTAYLINFSPAVKRLIEFMQERGLIITEVRGLWCKNRTFDTRMTPGDLEDEMVHMERLALKLIGATQTVRKISVHASLSYLRYVNEKAQKEMRELDPSIPEKPNSSTLMGLYVETEYVPDIMVALESSFIAPEQKRLVHFVLGHTLEPDRVAYVGKFEFDTKEGDRLTIVKAGEKDGTVMEEVMPSNKLSDETRAFLESVSGIAHDNRLTNFQEATLSVRITQAAIESLRQGRRIAIPHS